MATTPKISIRLSLDGKQEVKSGIDDVTAHGLAQFNKLKNAAGDALGDGGAKANAQLKAYGLHSLETASAANKLREALHVAHPILEEAGVGLSNLGAFAAAARAGLGGLAAATIGAAVLGLGKIGEEAKKAKIALDDLYGPKEAAAAKERIGQLAKGLGTSPGAILGPTAEIRDTTALLHGGQIFPGDRRPEKETTSFLELLRSHGAKQDDAAKIADTFFSGFKKQALQPGVTPKLTGEMLDALPRGVGNELSKMFGAGPDVTRLLAQIRDGRQISFEDVQRRLDLRQPAIHKQFLERPPEQRTTAEAFTGAKEAGEVALQAPGSKIDTLGVVLSDAVKHQLERTQAPEGAHPAAGVSSSSSFLLDLLRPPGATGTGGPQFPNLFSPRTLLGPRTYDELFGKPASLGAAAPAALPAPATIPALATPVPKDLHGPFPADETVPAVERIGIGTQPAAPYPSVEYDPATAKPGLPYGHTFPDSSIPESDNPGLRGEPGFPPLSPKIEIGIPVAGGGNAPSSVWQRLNDAANPARDALQGLETSAKAAADALKTIQPLPPAAPAGGAPAPAAAAIEGHAAGGIIRGPGTGTSDSILARLSHGEYVVNARATKASRPLLDMLNSGGLKDGGIVLRNFADGGGVDMDAMSNSLSPSPSVGVMNLSKGGESGPVQQHMIDFRVNGESQGKGMSDDALLNALHRASISKQTSAIGRRASWDR